ncbi:hypothetical protein [Pelagerythrobacter marensis]|uniref:Uncharacterized protein n=1 Tax=Pelagerythrobacter marensis TaxID=543877 RepID=A0A0G3X3N8_9SPHN|nr:hypothetical protein [Pelagerythrobacter marensis]AKM06130.1 hypothetical protein AM2010_36 [Pelagerythrobacter marensis]
MTIFEPFAFAAAVAAIVAAQFWWAVATVAGKHAGDAVRVNRKLHNAAVMTALALGLAAASVFVLPAVGLFY